MPLAGQSIPALAGVLSGAPGSADGHPADDPPADAVDSESARFVMLATASRALAGAAAESGLLVVLEDLQWADRTSLLLLRHLAGELARSRLLVVATFREPGDGPLANLLPALLRTEGTRPIRLTGLSRSDIAQWLRLLETGADVDGLAGRLWAGSGGNPLFVRMLVERGQVADDDPRGFPNFGSWPWLIWAGWTNRRGISSTPRACSVSGSTRRYWPRTPACRTSSRRPRW